MLFAAQGFTRMPRGGRGRNSPALSRTLGLIDRSWKVRWMVVDTGHCCPVDNIGPSLGNRSVGPRPSGKARSQR